MKVLAITPAFFPQLGGVEQVALELALRVREHGVTMDIAHVAAGLRKRTETVRGITTHRIPLYGNRFFGVAPALGALARGYDLLHVHDPQLLAVTANVRRACRTLPAVLSTHGGFWHTERKFLLKRLYEATSLAGAANHYRRVLASSGADLKYFQRFAARVELCTNGVDVARYRAIETQGRGNFHRWIYWGRLAANKRIDRIIEYAAHARRMGYPVDLLVCGRDVDGLLGALRGQAQALGVAGVVRFESYLSDAQLHEELKDRSVYITASEHEGFGLSVVEGMAAGLLVVCRDMEPLNAFFVDGESGCALRFDGAAQDLQKLGALLAAPAAQVKRMGAAAREAVRKYDWSCVAPQFVEQYRSVLAEDAVAGLAESVGRSAG